MTLWPGNWGSTLKNSNELLNHPLFPHSYALSARPATGKQLWSFRFGGGARALCVMEAHSVAVVAAFEPDHSKAYRNH